MTESERSNRPDYTRIAGDVYKGNVRADFAEVCLKAGLGTEEKPFPTVIFYMKDPETGVEVGVETPGIVVDLPYNGIRQEKAVVDPQGVLLMVRFSEDTPTILHPGSEAPLRLYADDSVQATVKHAIRHAANPEAFQEES